MQDRKVLNKSNYSIENKKASAEQRLCVLAEIKKYLMLMLLYGTVGAALLWTLEQGLGEAWTPEAKVAWTEVYGILSSTMIDSAAKAAA